MGETLYSPSPTDYELLKHFHTLCLVHGSGHKVPVDPYLSTIFPCRRHSVCNHPPWSGCRHSSATSPTTSRYDCHACSRPTGDYTFYRHPTIPSRYPFSVLHSRSSTPDKDCSRGRNCHDADRA